MPAADDVRFVFAVHGRNRGRFNPLADNFLQRLREGASPLKERLEVVRTGEGAAFTPSGRGVILFFLADPLKELYPDCYAEAARWRNAARAAGWRVLNDPDALSNADKGRQAVLWRASGIPHAQTARAESAVELEEVSRAIPFPMLIRSSGTHSQETIRLCHSEADIEAAAVGAGYPAIAAALIDLNEQWRQAEPDSLFARYHHKKRAMVFDGFVMPHHLFLSESIIVGGASCTLTAEHGLRAAAQRLMGRNHRRYRESLAADLDYAFGPAEAPELLRRAVTALGLDVAAVNYATRPNGEIVLWEVNPFFALPFEPLYPLPRERRLRYRMNRIFDALARAIETALPKPA